MTCCVARDPRGLRSRSLTTSRLANSQSPGDECARRGSGGQLATERAVRHLGEAEPRHRVARWPGAGRTLGRDTPHRAEPEPDALVTRADRLVQNVKVRPAGLYTYGS